MALRANVLTVTVLGLSLVAGRTLAQETPAPDKARPEARTERTPPPERGPTGPTANLRVQVVIGRYQGEKKVGSLPYSFAVTAGGAKSFMRMGVDTPVPMTTLESTDPKANVSATRSIQYRNVGTNLDCSARDLGDGRFELRLSVENSSALAGSERSNELSLPGVPLFRRFEVSLGPVLRDGQTIQTVASTDPVTGEVVKIDVTVNVVK